MKKIIFSSHIPAWSNTAGTTGLLKIFTSARIKWKSPLFRIIKTLVQWIEVLYDEQAQCWLVRGTLPEPAAGGVPNALISRDGTVLAVWHTM